MHGWRISDTSDSVVKYSLGENPFEFTRQRVKGAVFYMPAKGDSSGDTFEVEETGNGVVTTIVSDARGHGYSANVLHGLIRAKIQSIKHAFVAGRISQLERAVLELDLDLANKSEQLALTVSYLDNAGHLRILNFAENAVLVYNHANNNFIVNPESDVNVRNCGKLGFLSLLPELDFGHLRYMNRNPVMVVGRRDKLVIATDGVYGLDSQGMPESSPSYLYYHIFYSIRYSPKSIVGSINNWAQRNAQKTDVEKWMRHVDDYTLVVQEFL
ncbi:MAG: hypothetical protein ABIA93_04010 [Candidatus Woesearchaeota archaeon]